MSKTSLLREEGASPSVIPIEDARRRRRVEELTKLHGTYLRGLARKLCRSELDPDDLVQDVFEKTVKSLEAIPDGANERAWLARVLHNMFIDKLRRRNARREEPIDNDEPPQPPPAEEEVWWQKLTPETVRAAVAKLPDDYRVTFEMFAFERRSYDDIAATLKIAKATVGTRISRARQRLRDILTKERGDG